MPVVIKVENIKCGGCANHIQKTLSAIKGVESVQVAVEEGEVKVTFLPQMEGVERAALQQRLRTELLSKGYPETGSVEGLKAAGAKAKSFISCAVGKMTSTS